MCYINKLALPYSVEIDTVLIPISQGTEVTIVTEYVSFHAEIIYVYSSFTKLKSDHFVFASNFEMIQSNLD